MLTACASTGKNTTTTTKTTTSGSSGAAGSRPILTTSVAPAIEKEILRLVNQHRRSKGLNALADLAPMSVEARKHSANMASGKVQFGHFGFDTRRDVVLSQYPKMTAFAENVAYGSESAEEVVKGWLKSPGHKKNIEGNFTLSGIGVARNSKNQLYFTQLFAK